MSNIRSLAVYIYRPLPFIDASMAYYYIIIIIYINSCTPSMEFHRPSDKKNTSEKHISRLLHTANIAFLTELYATSPKTGETSVIY